MLIFWNTLLAPSGLPRAIQTNLRDPASMLQGLVCRTMPYTLHGCMASCHTDIVCFQSFSLQLRTPTRYPSFDFKILKPLVNLTAFAKSVFFERAILAAGDTDGETGLLLAHTVVGSGINLDSHFVDEFFALLTGFTAK